MAELLLKHDADPKLANDEAGIAAIARGATGILAPPSRAQRASRSNVTVDFGGWKLVRRFVHLTIYN